MGGVRVAVYVDLTAGQPLRAMRGSVEQTVADPLQRTQRRRCGFRGGDLAVTSGIARVFSVDAATELRTGSGSPRPVVDAKDVMVVMVLRP